MPFTVDDFFDFLAAASGQTVEGLTDALDSIAKSERGRSEDLFSEVIDQASFDTVDYDRIRRFLIDWYSAFKTIGTASVGVSDPNSLTNSDLDELFRSFGYEYSTILKDHDENPLPGKVRFFLDLVNLYKRKGTPQTIVDLLQYYGVTELDIYEFFLKFNEDGQLIFDGEVVAGTSEFPTTLKLIWPELIQNDPHWFQTEEQIRALNQQNIINLPSKTPYFGVVPVSEVDGPEISILMRRIQDQHDTWEAGGTLPEDAAITILGETHSLLELYLSAIYIFNKEYNVGADGTSFVCYDGTSTLYTDVLAEYNQITQRPQTRQAIKDQLAQYEARFTRRWPRNFLQSATNRDAAGDWLTTIDPALKASLDGLGSTNQEILFSLMKDLAIWVRNNIGFGFVNLGFIMFGLDAFFEDLKPVINFFKPYRARFLLFETLQMKNRLFNSIVTEDAFDHSASFDFHDYLTGDSIPCCNQLNIDSTDTQTICLDTTSNLHYSRDTYDCGSYHDVGAVTDLPDNVKIDVIEIIEEPLHCPQYCPEDSTSCVVGNISEFYFDEGSTFIFDGTSWIEIETESVLPVSLDFDPPPDSTETYVTELVDPVVFYQTGNWNDFDTGGSFDCTHGFDVVEITFERVERGLLQENGGALLQENGARILL